MTRIFKKKRSEESNIDLTPMLDVVFIMLIFFIVTASFVTEQGFFIDRPPEARSDEGISKNVVFVVSETDEIWLDDRRIDVRSVRANIEQARAENPEAGVIVRAHEYASAGTYVGIVDQAELAITDPNFAVALVTYNN